MEAKKMTTHWLNKFNPNEPQHQEVIEGDDYHGIYSNICLDCDRDFLGYKRRLYCKICTDRIEANEKHRLANNG